MRPLLHKFATDTTLQGSGSVVSTVHALRRLWPQWGQRMDEVEAKLKSKKGAGGKGCGSASKAVRWLCADSAWQPLQHGAWRGRSVARHVDPKICISPCALLSRGFQIILMCSRGYSDDLNGPVLCFQVILTCIWPSIGLLYNFQFSTASRARRRVAPDQS